MDEGMQWYERDMTLEQAMDGIEINMRSSVRNYIAVGFYLKAIRDRKLFQEAGYKNFEEFVRDKYDRDKGWASKCIKVNDQLSRDGNSPILAEAYKEYKVSQLVELAYLTDEQRVLASPDMTVKQLQAIRKPEPQPEPEVVTLQPGPEVREEEPEGKVVISQRIGGSKNKPEPDCFPDRSYCLRQECGTEPEEQERGQALGAVEMPQDPEEVQMEEPLSAVTQEAEKSGEVGSLPEKSGKCIHRPEFKCTLEEAYKLTPGMGEDCGCKCCWECVKHGNCEWECNSSLHRPEEPEEVKDYGTLETIGGVPIYSLKSKGTADGAYGWERSQIVNKYLRELHRDESYTIANQILPMEFQVRGDTYKVKYDGFYYVSFKEGEQTIMFVELDRLKEEYAAMYPPKKVKPVDTYDKAMLQSMIKSEQEQLDRMGPAWIEKQPYFYTKHMMALEAYKMLLVAHEEENESKIIG